jgi:hypothetical protein
VSSGRYAPVAASAPPDELRERVMASVRAEPAAPRAAGVRKRATLVTGAIIFSVVLSVAIGSPGLRGRPFAYVASLAVAWSLVGIAATWAGVARGRSMLGRPAVWRLGVVTLTPLALLMASAALGQRWPETLTDGAELPAHLLCVLGTVAFALGPLAAFVAMRRASDPVAPGLTGAAIAVAAGAWGALGIELHCRYASPFHVAVGHVLPVALLALVGVVVGRRLLAIRGENG